MAEAINKMQCFFAEDIVRLKKNAKTAKLGLVIKSGNHMSDEEDSSDSEDEKKVKSGELSVCWYPSGKEEIVSESKVELADRSLQPGDVIRHMDPQLHNYQKGYVTNIQIIADVSILGSTQVVKDVDCKNFTPSEVFSPGTKISYGLWVGFIDEVYQRVTLLLKNGYMCCLDEEQLDMLDDVRGERNEDNPFYSSSLCPGQHVVGPAKVFQNAKWTSKRKPVLKNRKPVKAIVKEVKVVKIDVSWKVCALCFGEETEKPPSTITEDQLDKVKFFQQFWQAGIQIGDKGYYILQEDDVPVQDINDPGAIGKTVDMTTDPSVAQATSQENDESCERSKNKTTKTNSEGNVCSVEEDMEQGSTDTSESDEGSVESDNSEQLKFEMSKTGHPTSLTHCSRWQRKRPRPKKKTHLTFELKAGDVHAVEVISTKTFADVMWEDGCVAKKVDGTNLIPIQYVDEHQFFPGYFVFDKRASKQLIAKYGVVKSTRQFDRTCTVSWFEDNTGYASDVEEDVSVYDIEHHPDMDISPGDVVVVISDSSSQDPIDEVQSMTCLTGEVLLGLDNGHVLVAGAGRNGDICSYKPQDLYIVDSEDEDECENSSENMSFDFDEWETASEQDNEDRNAHHDINYEETLDILHIPSPSNHDPDNAVVNNVDMELLNSTNMEAMNNTKNSQEATPGNQSLGFEILSEVPDSHKYKSEDDTTFAPNNPRMFMSVLKKESLLLKSSLPPGILIRGFENSMELFSFLIFGPEDTPYEDGVFLFDMALPADYPLSPPSVFYVSHSPDFLNPNLYLDGTVCVSLLGTWDGKDNEVWTSNSNILQVLLSIQGLILCKEPYFNEAGYDRLKGTVEGVENSRHYNEMVILQLIEATESILQTTHPVFDKEIKEHFKNKGKRFVKKFQSWINEANCSDKCKTLGERRSSSEEGATTTELSCNQAERIKIPDFPLFPLSRGFIKSLERSTKELTKVLKKI